MGRKFKGRSGRSSGTKARFHWFGNQFPGTAVAPATGRTLIELASGVQLERLGGGTLVSIRGGFQIVNDGTNADLGPSFYAAKIMYLRVDDAQVPDVDLQPIDNNEEDIAMRQLWMTAGRFPTRASDTIEPVTKQFDLNVKSKVVMRGGGKFSLWLIIQAESGATSRLNTSGYLRACVKY